MQSLKQFLRHYQKKLATTISLATGNPVNSCLISTMDKTHPVFLKTHPPFSLAILDVSLDVYVVAIQTIMQREHLRYFFHL